MSPTGGARAAAPGCRFCGAPGTLLHAGLRDRLFGVAGEWRHLRCEACDHVWLDPRPSEPAALYDRYYTHEGPGRKDAQVALSPAPGDPAGSERGVKAWIKRGAAARLGYGDAARGVGERTLGRTLATLRPLYELGMVSCMGLRGERRGQLLDVGCGDGTLLLHMQGLGWQVHGVEPDRRAAAVASARLGAERVSAADLSSIDFGTRRFDAITLSHVIEHLAEPEAALARCRALLAPGGRLAIATPNPHAAAARRFGSDWVHWDPPRHLEVYSASSLRRLVEEAGFEIGSLATPCGGAAFAWLASALLERDGSMPGVRVTGAGPWIWLRALAGLAREWRAVARGQPAGEELLMVAEARSADAAPERAGR